MTVPRPHRAGPLGALLLGAALLLLAACGENAQSPAEGADSADAVVQQSQSGGGSEGRGSDSGGSVSQSQTIDGAGSTIESHSSSSSSSQSQSSTSGGITMFSGSGLTRVEELSVDQPSRLSWTNTEGEPFTIRGGGVSVSSREGRGEVPLAPGSHDGLEVRGDLWTVVVRPR